MNIRASLQRRGAVSTVHLVLLRLLNFQKTPPYLIARLLDLKRYDRMHRVETAGIIELDQLEIPSSNREHGTRYSAVSPWLFKDTLDRLPIDHRSYTFVDLGSGKGGALFQASDYPFKEIIGVEFSTVLHEAAQRNLGTFRSMTRQCHKITAVCGDAAGFEYPERPWVLFFNSPFALPIWKRVAENIARSPLRSEQTSYLVFMNYGFNPGTMEYVEGLTFLRVFYRGETNTIFQFVP